jgi:uncharacterized protein with NAD-binding domain and iron-sulfur cluster
MRIAILGGGVGAMTAAYWLTNPGPDNKVPDHEVTVYQLGWRLGGKGASGRNAAAGQRIEEHGLHIWMGFYANAFRMMRNVYGELNRPAGSPLATWADAFKPQTVYTMMDKNDDDQWMPQEWIVATPIMPGEPGDQTGFGSPCAYHGSLLQWTINRIEAFLDGRETHTSEPSPLTEEHTAALKRIHGALQEVAAHHPVRERGTKDEPAVSHHHLLLELALKGVQEILGPLLDLSQQHIGLYRLLMLVDVAVATGLGMLRDLCGKPFEAIDGREWREWLLANGLHEHTSWSAIIRALYDIVFAYRDGDATDPSKADLAAGTTTKTILHINFDYYNAVFMKMQAGMGDTIFAPIYEVLKKRGVKFRFFHRLREIVPSDDGSGIDELHIGVQATVKNGEYDPFVIVKDLPCWPSTPNYDQLVQGDELREKHIDLESYQADWRDVEELHLKRGQDFDHVVFGLSLGAVPIVCPRLLDQKKEWRDMVEHVKVVRTQASQLWLSRNVADMGWPPALNGRCYGERAVFGTFVEPMDTWGDMSQVIPVEDWRVDVQNIAYFCGAMKDSDPPTTDIPRELTRSLLQDQMSMAWTRASANGRFRYDWLVVNDPNAKPSDEERYRAQYFRVNTEPTETYVLSVHGSTQYRLDPADNGYENLSLAGDWVQNGLAIGCVESAVLGGMKGVQKLCPHMVIVE